MVAYNTITAITNHDLFKFKGDVVMGNKRKSKFHIGDIVVISLYGTVGTITDVKMLNGTYAYEVNYSEGLYLENTLCLFTEYEDEVYEMERINIELNYFFGDLVMVAGYGSELFKVEGFRTEIWRYKEDAWEEVIYELSRIADGEWLEVTEEEITLIADVDQTNTLLQKLGLLYFLKKDQKSLELHNSMNKFRKSEKELLLLKKERKEIIDGLLDTYNDYKLLYEMFHDDEYKQVMDLVMNNIKRFVMIKRKVDES